MQDFEFIIVNDYSTDKTADIVRNFKNDKRIKFVENEKNIGQAFSINRAVKLSKGEYIAKIDADDIAMPERLKRQSEFLDKNKNTGLVGSRAFVIDEEGELLGVMPAGLSGTMNLKEFLSQENPFVHSSMMFRRDIFENIGGYRDFCGCVLDYDLALRFSEVSDIHILDDFLCKYRINKKGVTFKEGYTQPELVKLVLHLAKQRRSGEREDITKARGAVLAGVFGARKSRKYILSRRYYGMGCIYLLKGNKRKARATFFDSLSLGFLNPKAVAGLALSFLPFSIVKRLGFMFGESSKIVSIIRETENENNYAGAIPLR